MIIRLVSENERTVAGIARELGSSRRAIGRVVASLERSGMVARNSSNRLVPGRALLAAARRIARSNELRAVGRAIVDEVAQATQCTALLHALHGDQLLPEVSGVPSDVVAISFPVGRTIPVWQGIGRAALAFRSDEAIALVARRNGVDGLEERVAEEREKGYAVSFGEVVPGVTVVGAAVLDASGEPIGVLAAATLQAEKAEKLGPYLRTAAERLSQTVRMAQGART
jgi:DNA-binding IclR family transcriptional regulator